MEQKFPWKASKNSGNCWIFKMRTIHSNRKFCKPAGAKLNSTENFRILARLPSLLEISLGKCCSTGNWKLPKIQTGRLEVGCEDCQWMVKICSEDFFNDWWYFNNGQRDKIVNFSPANRRRDLSKSKTKPTSYFGLSASRHSLSHKLEYARTGDLFFRLFLRDTFRATNWWPFSAFSLW